MTKDMSVADLAKLTAVTARAIYPWIEKCSADLKEKLGDLSGGARFSLLEAVEILRAGGRDTLANLISELAIAQEFIPEEPMPGKATSEYTGEIVIIPPPKAGRPARTKERHAWVALNALASSKDTQRAVLATLYRADAQLRTIDGDLFVAMNTIPAAILEPYISRIAPSVDPDLEEYRGKHTNQYGELWVYCEDVAAALQWSCHMVGTKAWRTGWLGRKAEGKEHYEYDLRSIQQEYQPLVLRYLVDKEREQ